VSKEAPINHPKTAKRPIKKAFFRSPSIFRTRLFFAREKTRRRDSDARPARGLHGLSFFSACFQTRLSYTLARFISDFPILK